MLCMTHYYQRLAHAMACRHMSPADHQTHLARLVGHGCKPQNIQHLLDPAKHAKSSKYTPMIAAVLNCDTVWLATGNGTAPTIDDAQQATAQTPATMATEPAPPPYYWPWSVSPDRIAALPPDFFGRLDGYIEGRVEEFERANKPHQVSPLGQRAA